MLRGSTSTPASSISDVVLLTTTPIMTPTAALLSAAATATGEALNSMIVSALTAGPTAAAGGADGPKAQQGANGECELLGPFALFIQASLGLLAGLSLVWKRYRERPQRPLKIWGFDVSKQVVGSVLVHIANLLMSMLSAGQLTVKPGIGMASTGKGEPDEGYKPNPCSFYLLNLAIDTTLGIPILIFLLRLLTHAFSFTSFGQPLESIRSGNYGQPPKTSWWFKQSLIYFLGLLGMKMCVLVIFSLLPWISRIGDWALRWTEGNEMVQVFFVMLLFPVIMNAIQYYIIDSFIKNQSPEAADEHSHDRLSSSPSSPSRTSFHPVPASDSASESEEEAKEPARIRTREEQPNRSDSSKGRKAPPARLKRPHEYDPTTDGEDSPTIVGSGSPNNEEEGPLIASSSTSTGLKAGEGKR